MWSAKLHDHLFKKLWDDSSDVDRARLSSLQSRFAGSWLFGMASCSRSFPLLPAETFRTAMRIRLGLPVFDADKLPTCVCKQVMDVYGRHALQCMGGGHRHEVHNRVRDSLRQLTTVGHPGQTSTEVHPFFGDYAGFRLDVGVYALFARGVHGYDVAVISHNTDERVRDAMSKPGAACTLYEANKHRRYGPAIADARTHGFEVQLTPLVFDVYGAMGEAAQAAIPKLIRAAGNEMVGDSAGARATTMAAQWLFSTLTEQVAGLVIRHMVAA